MQKLRLASSTISLALFGGISFPANADIITDWNETALAVVGAAKLPSGAPNRIMALMHVAMFDAANSITPKYTPYVGTLPTSKSASGQAAVSAAAYRVLMQEVPAAAPRLEQRLTELTTSVADGPDKIAGLALGEAAAQAVLAARKNDGTDYSADYVVTTGSSAYALTAQAQMSSPSLGKMKPFTFDASSQFRPPPPPPADSPQALRDAAEVKMLGDASSTQRTADQTTIAHFHVPPGTTVWNGIARAAIQFKSLPLVDSARVMALVNLAAIDAQLAIWDAKYHYNYWRPRTAIKASTSGLVQSASAQVNPDWAPLLAEPMHPEYPCAHCGVGGAATTVLEHLFGYAPFKFKVSTGALKGLERPYESFREFAEEEAASRIYGGVHFRWSNIVGDAVGRQVGTKVIDRLKPIGG